MSSESNIKAKKSEKWAGLRMEQTIDSLISAPLMAASKANVAMALAQARFLKETCFNKEEYTKNVCVTQNPSNVSNKDE